MTDKSPQVQGGVQLPARASIGCLATWFGAKGDYEAARQKAMALTGWRRYISTGTVEGRVCLAVATLAGYAIFGSAGYLYYRKRKSKKELIQ